MNYYYDTMNDKVIAVSDDDVQEAIANRRNGYRMIQGRVVQIDVGANGKGFLVPFILCDENGRLWNAE